MSKVKIGNVYSLKITGKGKRAGQSRIVKVVKAGIKPVVMVDGEKRQIVFRGEDMLTGDQQVTIREQGARFFNADAKLIGYTAK
jgi:hemin uptake protein HemP